MARSRIWFVTGVACLAALGLPAVAAVAQAHSVAKGAVTGRLYTKGRSALSKKTVMVFRYERSKRFKGTNPEVVVKTSKSGAFVARGLNAGTWYIYAAAPGNHYVWQRIRVADTTTRAGRLYATHAGYELYGRAPDDYGYLSGEVYHDVISWSAKKNRQYAVHSVPPGRYSLASTCPEGGNEVDKTIRVRSNMHINLGGLPCSQ